MDGETRFDRLETRIEEVRDALIQLQAVVSASPRCPDPGACVRVERSAVDLNRRVMVLELSNSERRGERTILVAVSTVIGAGIGWILQLIK